MPTAHLGWLLVRTAACRVIVHAFLAVMLMDLSLHTRIPFLREVLYELPEHGLPDWTRQDVAQLSLLVASAATALAGIAAWVSWRRARTVAPGLSALGVGGAVATLGYAVAALLNWGRVGGCDWAAPLVLYALDYVLIAAEWWVRVLPG